MIIYKEEIDSTNLEAARLAEKLDHGTVIAADSQTACGGKWEALRHGQPGGSCGLGRKQSGCGGCPAGHQCQHFKTLKQSVKNFSIKLKNNA